MFSTSSKPSPSCFFDVVDLGGFGIDGGHNGAVDEHIPEFAYSVVHHLSVAFLMDPDGLEVRMFWDLGKEFLKGIFCLVKGGISTWKAGNTSVSGLQL
jgi:hypothetical protein